MGDQLPGFVAEVLAQQLGSRWPWACVIVGERVPKRGALVAKKDLVTNAPVQFNRGRVHIAADIPFADELAGYTVD